MKLDKLFWMLMIVAVLITIPAAAQEEPAEEPETREEAREEAAEEAGLAEVSENQYGGYPPEPRIVGGPTDVSADLARSFPKKNAVTGGLPIGTFFKWKQDLYNKTGIKLSFSYQAVGQKTSDVTTGFPLPGGVQDWTAGGWLLIEGKWDALNKGKDWQGGITAALDWRHEFGDIEPTLFQVSTGSLWPTEWTLVAWDPWFSQLYWEQWGKKDRFVFRIGTQLAVQTIDFFRFKDGRTAFSSAQMTLPSTTMPWPGPGLGAMFEWWPIKDSPLYIIGTVNDMNADPGSFSWGNAFDYKQFFYAVEVGAHVGQFPRNFDHYHLTLYYADEKDTQVGGSAFLPNKAGWGFKVAGEKQWGKIVGFANYSYNTAEGGFFGLTLGEHGINAGVARQMPFGYRGEVAVGASWVQPKQEFETGAPVWNNRRDQYGLEAYWKLLLTPALWITPNVQMIWNPSFNLDKDFIVVGGFKFRWFV